MFTGEYSHALDAKNRLMLPAKLREKLGEDLFLAKSVDKCLSLYTASEWEAFSQKLNALPGIEIRNVRRFLFSAAFNATVDGQGRILVPANLCEYAGLTKDVAIIGVGDHVEIWDAQTWKNENSAQNGSEIAEILIKLGF